MSEPTSSDGNDEALVSVQLGLSGDTVGGLARAFWDPTSHRVTLEVIRDRNSVERAVVVSLTCYGTEASTLARQLEKAARVEFERIMSAARARASDNTQS